MTDPGRTLGHTSVSTLACSEASFFKKHTILKSRFFTPGRVWFTTLAHDVARGFVGNYFIALCF